MESIEFEILGKPLAKGRPRFTARGGFARAYTPKKTTDYETLVKFNAQKVAPKELWLGALAVEITAYLPIPKSMTKKRLEMINSFDLRPTTRPDIDNYAKIVLDALNEIIYKDDNQVVGLHVYKHYSENPRMHVVIKKLFND